ncbi:FUSC family protein [Clostridium sp. JS66]|uniref:FUSC family protein n=1 Tax=Clostridium sp. JS66 TaxID=3064705 RepID=UPI00298D97E0|nr:aromatic acid exporter family protein [Clostridium sp. JS66]WPC40363.1 aromatic acid exporter family protein [Clostridium sp. JS66]
MNLKRKAIRVGIAASLCILVSNLLKLKYPFFVVLPAVMPISTFFGETIKFGANRIIGSFIGAIIGVVLITFQWQNTILIGIGVMLIIYICSYLKWDSTTSIACLVFVSIMLGVKGAGAISYSAYRLLDTLIGISITTIVNNYVFNPNMIKVLKNRAQDIQQSLLNLASDKEFIEDKSELDNIEKSINSLKENLKIYSEEIKVSSKFLPVKNKLDKMMYIFAIIFQQVEIINYINVNDNFHDLNKEHINMIISFHKDIFFREMKNLNEIIKSI